MLENSQLLSSECPFKPATVTLRGFPQGQLKKTLRQFQGMNRRRSSIRSNSNSLNSSIENMSSSKDNIETKVKRLSGIHPEVMGQAREIIFGAALFRSAVDGDPMSKTCVQNESLKVSSSVSISTGSKLSRRASVEDPQEPEPSHIGTPASVPISRIDKKDSNLDESKDLATKYSLLNQEVSDILAESPSLDFVSERNTTENSEVKKYTTTSFNEVEEHGKEPVNIFHATAEFSGNFTATDKKNIESYSERAKEILNAGNQYQTVMLLLFGVLLPDKKKIFKLDRSEPSIRNLEKPTGDLEKLIDKFDTPISTIEKTELKSSNESKRLSVVTDDSEEEVIYLPPKKKSSLDSGDDETPSKNPNSVKKSAGIKEQDVSTKIQGAYKRSEVSRTIEIPVKKVEDFKRPAETRHFPVKTSEKLKDSSASASFITSKVNKTVLEKTEIFDPLKDFVSFKKPSTSVPLKTHSKERLQSDTRRFKGFREDLFLEYEVLQKIGEGTFGEVYKAMSKRTREIVAMKRILPHPIEEKEGYPITGYREIRILKTLDHENIIKLIEIGVASEGTLFGSVFLA